MKKNLLLLHGALGNSAQFNMLKPLLETNFNCYSFDFEGHGTKSASNPDFRIETFAQNIIEYIAENELGPVSVFGYSMGGYAAIYAATLQPGLFTGIMTLGTKFKWTVEYATKEVRFLNPDIMLQKVPAFAQELENRHGIYWQAVVNKTAAMMHELGYHPVLTPELLSSVKIPVTLGLGDRDNTVTVEETLEIRHLIPHAALSVLPATPHPFEKLDYSILPPLIIKQLYSV
jgi:pimeloyl-ACP methyl ester carboxylesterase